MDPISINGLLKKKASIRNCLQFMSLFSTSIEEHQYITGFYWRYHGDPPGKNLPQTFYLGYGDGMRDKEEDLTLRVCL